MMMIMRIAPHLWDFVVFKKSYYSDVNSLLCSETSREASPAKQQIYQVLYLFVFYLFLRGKLSNKYTIYDIYGNKYETAGAFASRGESSRSRARFQNPVKLSKFRSSKFGIKSQKFLGTWDPEFWVFQPTDVLKCAGDLSFWWDHWRWKLFSSHLSWKPKLL